MRIATTDRKLFVSLVAFVALAFGAGAAHAQFAAPTCTPPNCSPAVIQNIPIASGAQNASINITGDAKVGATFQAGGSTPVLNASGQNLYYGNVAGTSSAGSLLLLQFGAADRFRIGLTGDVTSQGVYSSAAGSVGVPSYTFNGDSNTGLYSLGADAIGVTTGGVNRLMINNGGVSIGTGVLYAPAGTVSAPGLSFNGDPDTGLYRTADNVMNVATNGVRTMVFSATNSVVVPGMLHVQGGLDANLGGNGSGITNINANNITSGTLNDARLSSNVALLNRTGQTFTGTNTFSSLTTFGASAGPVISINNSVGGVEIGGISENAFNFYTQGSIYNQIDSNNNSTNSYYWLNGAGANVMTLDESGNFDVEGMVTLGSPDMRLLNPGENLIYGNVDQFAAGNILLLQAESVDRFSVDADGNVVAAGTITSSGQAVCLQNGANCPQSVGGFGTPNALAKFDASGYALTSSSITDDGATIGVGGAPSASYAMTVYGVIYANALSTPRIDAYAPGAGATAIYGTADGAGSTGIYGSGASTGIYGSSAATGVYGRSTGAGAGVYGSSSSGYGGDFSSLRVAGVTLFQGGVTLANSTTLQLGLSAVDVGGTNGRMYYNSTTNKFRCYENGSWQDCRDGGMGGSGTVNTIPKFTAASTIGNSTLTDDGVTVTAAQNFAVNGNTTIGNAAADTLTLTGTAVATPNNLNIDANTLYVDALNNRVGVGTNAPGTTLAVAGTLAVTGNTTLGDAAADRTTINGELVLGSQATNPAGVNGMMFYNSLNNKFRCYENGTWINCGGEEDTLDTVAVRGAIAYRSLAIDTNGGGTFLGGEALTIEGTGTGIYSSATDYGVRGNTTGVNGIGVWGGGQLYGGYFGATSAAGYAVRADAFSANNIAVYAQGRLQVTQTAGFGGAAPSAAYGIQTQGNYGIVSYGQGANNANYGGYLYGSGATTANYGVAAYGIGGTTAYGVLAYAQGGTNNYALYATLGSIRTTCATNDSETDSIVCEDIAEVYETGEHTEPGDVIVWRPDVDNKVYKSRKPYEDGIAGIYSTSPGVLMGNQDVNGKYGVELGNANTAETIKKLGSTHAAVALAGRVPVKVTLEGGAIKPGDLLTSSSKAGYAMKASKTGRVVCMAMESFDEYSKGDKVMCYVNPHQWVDPREYDGLKSDLESMKADIEALKAKK